MISPSQQTQLTYRDLDEHSNALARAWQALGIRKGDRVAVSLGNGWEFAVATYAIWKLGAVLVGWGFFLVSGVKGGEWDEMEWIEYMLTYALQGPIEPGF